MAAVLVLIYIPNDPDDETSQVGLVLAERTDGSADKSGESRVQELQDPAADVQDTADGSEMDAGESTRLLTPGPSNGMETKADREEALDAGRGDRHGGDGEAAGGVGNEPGPGAGETECRAAEGTEGADRTPITTETFTLADALQVVLESLDVKNDVWTKTDDEVWWQVSFVVRVDNCDAILRRLTTLGLGNIQNTSITLFPASYHNTTKSPPVSELGEGTTSPDRKQSVVEEKSDFVKSIRSRLTVAQVVSGVEGNARATFDFIMLMILASFIAGLGLVENSSVILVASMLISPLMGPILGGTFGFVIQNRDLTLLGVRNANIGLAICLVVGLLFGLLVAGVNAGGADWGGSNVWPTPEMKSRGMLRSLWVGILIALPSGAGVALSVLGGNVGSLVGVAISASLLPPAVNAGMLWAYSIVTAISPPAVVTMTGDLVTVMSSVNTSTINNSSVLPTPPPVVALICPSLENNDYVFAYSCAMTTEAAILGAVSLFLTILNIFCIFIVGIGVLKIKEVAPHTAVSEANEAFWKRDLPVARETYKTLKGKESLNMAQFAKKTAKEWKNRQENTATVENWSKIISDVEDDAAFQDVMKRIPGGARGPLLLRSFSYAGNEAIKEMDSDKEDNDLAEPQKIFHPYGSVTDSSCYVTPASSMGSPAIRSPFSFHRHANPFEWGTPPSHTPSTATPATPEDKKFIFDGPVPLRCHRRIPHRVRKQRSLQIDDEIQSLRDLVGRPQTFGRFTVNTIREEDEGSSLERDTGERDGKDSGNKDSKKTVQLNSIAIDMEKSD